MDDLLGCLLPDCLPFDIFYAEGEVADLLKAKLWASALVKYLAD